jgi:signal transduction histidine kinase
LSHGSGGRARFGPVRHDVIRSVKRDLGQAIDAAVLVLVGAIVVLGAGLRADASTRVLAVILAAAASAALVFRRRAPFLALVLSGGFVLVLFAFDHAAGTIAVVAPAAALYSLALARRRALIVVGTVAAMASVVLADVFLAGRHTHTLTLQTVGHAALVAVPVLAGEALRNHRSYLRLLLERLELAERTREEEAQRRAEQERLRIARELHDVVAHTLTTINVQAGVAKHLLDREPDHAEGALATIESASRDALQELRAIVGVLRGPGEQDAPLEPAPGLAAIDALMEEVRMSSGDGEIDFRIEGQQPEHVPDAVQLAAFRIVQESLTNSRRHAPGARAAVTLAYGSDRLRLTIENALVNGHNGKGEPGGAGIVGMRERAAALGGSLQTVCSDLRFRVAAELPYRIAR